MLKFRLYYDKDVEEKWLNKMSESGWAFRKFLLGFYFFDVCEPGEYRYQIDLLNNWSGDKEDFSFFMKENHIDVISQWYRWVYLRKKRADGILEIYTDNESKIAQYNRIKKFFTVALIIEIICLIMEINAAMRTGDITFWGLVIFIGMIVLVLLRMIWKCSWKIEKLKEY
ncbi:MAG: DUF2812 domain-containing protein [Eubacteriales bacterium]